MTDSIDETVSSEGEAGGAMPGDSPDVALSESPRIAPRWQERDAWTALAALDESPELVPALDWPAGLTCLDRPGLYAWWVDEAGAGHLSRGLDRSLGLGLAVAPGRIYAGQAGATKWPSGKAGDATLRTRIGGMHLGGRVRMSTFRWTLASVLFDQLEVQVQAAMVVTPSSERALTEWMREHLSVAVHPHDDRDTLGGLEHAVLEKLDPAAQPGRSAAHARSASSSPSCAAGSAGRPDPPACHARLPA